MDQYKKASTDRKDEINRILRGVADNDFFSKHSEAKAWLENADGNQKSDMIQLSKVNKRRYTRTNQIYEKYMADKAFLLTFQSQHLEHLDDSEGSSDEVEIYYRGTESNRNTAHINGDFTENGSSIALPRNDSRNLSSYMGSIRGSNRHGSQLSHALSLNSIQHV